MNRPAIPREVVREILIEAGHRCAVCGVPNPLERAHIIPWRKVKSHEKENLICLCANCHERADLEHWGEKTLQTYKQRPWVARHNQLDLKPIPTSQVEIIIDYEMNEFDDCKEVHLLHALAGFLRISPTAIRVVRKEEGSVRLILEMPSSAAEKLVSASSELKEGLPFRLVQAKLAGREKDRAIDQRPQSAGKAVVAEVATKHDQNFEEIFRAYYRPVYSFFCRRFDAGEIAEDLTQEVFLRAYRGLGTFRKDARFKSWLFKIVSHVYRDYLRQEDVQHGQDVHVTLEPSGAVQTATLQGPLSGALTEERVRLLREALGRLPVQVRRCVVLRVNQEMKYREIAAVLKLSESTVKSHLFSARKRLEETITGEIRALEETN